SRLMLKTMLELNNVKVVEADDGEAAVSTAMNESPDLILMNLDLPQLDGIAAMRRIRETDALRHVPVVFLTSYVSDINRHAALDAGGCDFLVKPISSYAFYRILKRHFSHPDSTGSKNKL